MRKHLTENIIDLLQRFSTKPCIKYLKYLKCCNHVHLIRLQQNYILCSSFILQVKQGNDDYSLNLSESNNGDEISMWPKIFTTESYSDQKVAIVVLNTHTKSNEYLFQLSTLLSSIQCYTFDGKEPAKIHSELQTRFLDDWARESKESDKGRKPLQRMLYIARNWQFAHDTTNGILDRNDTGTIAKLIIDEMKKRDTIFNETTYTYLISENHTNLKQDLEKEKRNLTKAIFDRQYIAVKKIHGEEMRVRHLYRYVHKLVSAFKKSPTAANVYSVSLIQCKY